MPITRMSADALPSACNDANNSVLSAHAAKQGDRRCNKTRGSQVMGLAIAALMSATRSRTRTWSREIWPMRSNRTQLARGARGEVGRDDKRPVRKSKAPAYDRLKAAGIPPTRARQLSVLREIGPLLPCAVPSESTNELSCSRFVWLCENDGVSSGAKQVARDRSSLEGFAFDGARTRLPAASTIGPIPHMNLLFAQSCCFGPPSLSRHMAMTSRAERKRACGGAEGPGPSTAKSKYGFA